MIFVKYILRKATSAGHVSSVPEPPSRVRLF